MDEESIVNGSASRVYFKEKSEKLLFDLITSIPESLMSPTEAAEEKVKKLIQKASTKSAILSATLAIPAGPLGVITIFPDLMAIWRIQAQLIADIAASYGKIALLSRETMVWCLFRHTASQIVRDVVVRSGSRIVTNKISVSAMRALLKRIGVQSSSKIAGRALFRVIPALGALGSGTYAYYDTREVGKTAESYFKALSDNPPINNTSCEK